MRPDEGTDGRLSAAILATREAILLTNEVLDAISYEFETLRKGGLNQ